MKKKSLIWIIIVLFLSVLIIMQLIRMYNYHYPHIDMKVTDFDSIDTVEEKYQLNLNYDDFEIKQYYINDFTCKDSIFSEKKRIGNKIYLIRENPEVKFIETFYIATKEIHAGFKKYVFEKTNSIYIDSIEVEIQGELMDTDKQYSLGVLYQFEYNDLYYAGEIRISMFNEEDINLIEYFNCESLEQVFINYLRITYLFLNE